VLHGGRIVEPGRFGHNLREVFGGPHEPLANRVGSEFGRSLGIALNFPEPSDDGSESDGEVAPPKPKRTRTKHERVAGEVKHITGVSARELQEENKDGSHHKELDSLMSALKKACKENPNGVDYYRFVIDPTSFAATVENMFYVSFLIRDKRVRLTVNKETGLPTIARVRSDEEIDATECVQHITTLDQETWKKLIHRLDIRAPLIQR